MLKSVKPADSSGCTSA